MSRLSSDTLFHYVHRKEYLLDILLNDFHPRYVKEKLLFQSGELQEVAMPMLCFCDITLSNISEHVEWYGSYGIGMKKEWAISKGLTPVHYYNPLSHVIKELSVSIDGMKKALDLNGDTNLIHSFIGYYYNLWFMKQYNGTQYKPSLNKEVEKKFYDEREWRYIPSLEELRNLGKGTSMSIVGQNLLRFNSNPTYKQEINNKLREDISLDFGPSDISYIIIKDESDRADMIRKIKHAKQKFDRDTIELLFSKIVSLEQIRKDF
ncbi:abortive infection system antitoxin AbiGi family protein [Petrocella sp. FN5]|uniref:abortive infection system antitoxin AbiGi family protein n=1 Tax=Petrocella sp. FN5 TaxID=3032002 RepID=UPI0023DCB079|nr:abortive infection system antitoxin AbiGi family protein [Petrocella sp. FN5]MDF1617301.1 abortive infection system antitoxin AbiGi family protein [Petrocella sp. FN5]